MVVENLRRRPVFADPAAPIRLRRDEIARLHLVARSAIARRVQQQHTRLASLAASVRALSPAATLERGFAIVRTADGLVVRAVAQAATNESLRVTVADGDFTVTSNGPTQTSKVQP
jgi:exodeoxyribonuclease VII large subunit